jgi:hypothetical protein
MGERTHSKVDNQAKIIQSRRQEEQSASEKPSEALNRLSGNVARPGDVEVLQKSVGNQIVQRLVQTSGALIQRSFRDDPDYVAWRTRMVSALGPMTQSLNETIAHHATEGEAIDSMQSGHNSSAGIWNEAMVTGGGGAGTSGEGPAGEEGETATAEGG